MLYLPQDHTPSAVFYRTTQVYGAFTDLLVLRGRTDYFDSILDRCFRLSVLAALTEWIHKAMQKNKPTKYSYSIVVALVHRSPSHHHH